MKKRKVNALLAIVLSLTMLVGVNMHGEQVMSAVMFTEQEANGISFFADGAAKIDVVKYDLV